MGRSKGRSEEAVGCSGGAVGCSGGAVGRSEGARAGMCGLWCLGAASLGQGRSGRVAADAITLCFVRWLAGGHGGSDGVGGFEPLPPTGCTLSLKRAYGVMTAICRMYRTIYERYLDQLPPTTKEISVPCTRLVLGTCGGVCGGGGQGGRGEEVAEDAECVRGAQGAEGAERAQGVVGAGGKEGVHAEGGGGRRCEPARRASSWARSVGCRCRGRTR